jgi:NAD(P)-dependent dehydrogenase (short-subunit alcohol dehydrogenase family)
MLRSGEREETVPMRMDGKVAVVTGAARGNGRAIAERLASEGARILCADVDEKTLVATVADINAGGGGRAETVRCDVAKEDDIERLMSAAEERGGPHAVVAQAGILYENLLENTEPADWDRMMAVDVRGTYLCARAAIPRMRKLGGGSIVNMSGTYAFWAEPGNAASCAAKGAIASLTRAIAIEVGDAGIRCNCIAPGYVETPMVARWLDAQPDPRAAREKVGKMHALGRIAKPSEIAAMAAFLCSDDASFCTAQTFIVDGGQSAGINSWQASVVPIP